MECVRHAIIKNITRRKPKCTREIYPESNNYLSREEPYKSAKNNDGD